MKKIAPETGSTITEAGPVSGWPQRLVSNRL
jgi:hypothetical protein